MSNWLKAGLIGAAVIVALNLLGLILEVLTGSIPSLACIAGLLGCVTLILGLVIYGSVGALAAYWMAPVRMAGPAAGHGALAGLIAGAIGGAMNVVFGVIRATAVDSAQVLSQFPPDALEGMYEAGIDPSLFWGPAGAAVFGTICCAIGVAIAAGLGALGGVIFAAVKPGEPAADAIEE